MKQITAIFVCLIICSYCSKSQVGIMPPVIYIDAQSRSGEYEIFNNGEETREIDVSLKFGYSDTDSLGNAFINYDDKIATDHSLIPYTKVFPKKFTLKGGSQQTVKFLLMMPKDSQDGTYWSRIITKSSPVRKQIDTSNYHGEIKASFMVVLELVNLMIFQKGKISTLLSTENPRIIVDSAKVNLIMDMTQSGNSPSWANVSIDVKDSQGTEVTKINEPIAVYFKSIKKFSFDKSKFKVGKYKADILINNERKDIPEDKWIKFSPIRQNFEFEIKTLE